MNCEYCGKQITSEVVVENNYNFCNNLCKYLWKGKEEESKIATKKNDLVFLDNLDFEFNIPGFETQKILIRGSYWKGAHFYVDNKKIKPFKRKIFKRERIYQLSDNQKNEVLIKVKDRPFDPIPSISVNDNEIELFKKLAWYEYLWIGLPVVLIFMGGIIGGIIGSGALFSNSILFRKVNHKLLRYVFTGLTSVIAVVLFFQAIVILNPYLQEFTLKTNHNITANSEIANSTLYSPLTSKVWEFYKMLDTHKNDVTDPNNIIIGSKRYFNGNGVYTQVLSNGATIIGEWKIDLNSGVITIVVEKQEFKGKIIKISESELIVNDGEFETVHRPI